MQNVKRVCRRYCFLLAAALVAAGSGENPRVRPQTEQPQGNSVGNSIFETPYSCKGTAGGLRVDDLTVMDFTIGASTIRDVRKRFSALAPAKLTAEEEAEEGICLKDENGAAVVFATSVMGAPDTLTSIYLAPARLIESGRLVCKSINLPTGRFSSKSGIRVGATAAQVSKILRSKVRNEGLFCVAYEILSSKGPLQHSKEDKLDGFTDSTGAEGNFGKGMVEWVKLFGITSN